MGIENIKALYKKAGAFNAIASVNSKSTPGSGLHSASALIAHVTANPLRVDESDDEIVIGQLATTYRKAIKELYLSELEPTNQLAFDCIVHITLNCNKAVRASMEIASAINVSARFGGFAVAMNPLPSSGTANIFYFASSAKQHCIEGEIHLMARLLFDKSQSERAYTFHRYFSPILGVSEHAYTSPVIRALEFVDKNRAVNESRVDNLVPFLGQFTTYVHSYSHTFRYLIEDAIRFIAGQETLQKYIENPLISNDIYQDKA